MTDFKRWLVRMVWACGVLLTSAAAACTVSPPPQAAVGISPATPEPLLAAPAVEPGLDVAERRIIEVYQRVSGAVVNVNSQVLRSNFFYGVYPEEGSGSGFVWDAAGHIVTNFHVVADASTITVSFGEGSEVDAQVVGIDPPNDLAVLRAAFLPDGVTPIELGDSDGLLVGQRAIAIGNPFGQFERTLTVGVISAVNRTVEVGDNQVLRGVIQTDASINRGNSGGPLLDSSGRLIGVNTAIYSPSGTSAGVGLAIPANKLKRVVPELIATGRFPHPWLGVEGLGYPLSAELARVLRLPVSQGLLIAQVFSDSPAQRAGIRPAQQEALVGRRRMYLGGDLLVAVDGRPLATWDDLNAYLEEQTRVGQQVTLTIWREGQRLTVPVELGEEPM